MRYTQIADFDVIRTRVAEKVAANVVEHLAQRYPDIEGMALEHYRTDCLALVKRSLEAHACPAADYFMAFHDIEPTESNLQQLNVFLDALKIHSERNARYKDVWKITGWRGALFDIYKKATRLWIQFRGGTPTEGADHDDALDLINFAAFFIRGQNEGNEFGVLP